LADNIGLKDESNIKLAIQAKMDEFNRRKEENPTLKIEPDPDLLKLAKSCEVSGLTSHFATTGHSFNFSNPKIVDRSNNNFVLGVLEMIHIKMNPGVNKITDTQNLNPAYFGLLEKTMRNYQKFKNHPAICQNK
jgi:hypothetical protein